MNITGIQNGAVLQRNKDDVCEIIIAADFKGLPKATSGEITKISDNTYMLSGIPVGGPYSVTISDDGGSVSYSDIYVGDVWLLAGQSNMQGAGRLRQRDFELRENPNPFVRAIYMDDEWDGAKPNLHQLWLSNDWVIRKLVINDKDADRRSHPMAVDCERMEDIQGVGPGLFTGLRLYEKLGVPQGLIPCAIGGASISQWTPSDDGEETYYSAAIRRIKLCGSRIKGMFWYQGEGYEGTREDYIQRFEKIRNGIKQVCNMDHLPTVQAQLAKCLIPSFMELEEQKHVWSQMRETQLYMENLDTLVTVPTNDFDLDDCIHLNAPSQEILGKRFADAMINLISDSGLPQPRLKEMYVTKDINHSNGSGYTLHIAFDNVSDKLTSKGVPYGFLFSKDGKRPTMASIQRIELIQNEVLIRFELSLSEIQNLDMWYGYGIDFYCNITDEGDRALPNMGPVQLKNVCEKA